MIILNTFYWKFADITKHLEFFKYQGIDATQTSPITENKPINEQYVDKEWWKLYQSLSFNIGNRLGTKEDLIEYTRQSHNLGMKSFFDCVIRHVAESDKGGCIPHELVDKDLLKYIINNNHMNNPNDRYHIIHGSWNLPMLDYNNTELQQNHFIKFLDEAFDIGFDGFRIDECKHYSLRHENGTFFDNVISRYMDKFIYGECLNCHHDILYEYSKEVNLLIDQWSAENSTWDIPNSKIVTFFESHDTYYHDWGHTKHLTTDERLNKLEHLVDKFDNVLVFTRPNDNMVFTERFRKICTKNK